MNRTLFVFVLALFALSAQQPTCTKCSATYIPESEVKQYLAKAKKENLTDQQIRAVNVGKSNVAVGVVYRPKLTQPGTVAEHDKVSEVYHVISGSATLVTGSDIEAWQPRPADNRAVKELNGPGGDGKSIRNPQTHQLKAGDVIVIPAGVGHWFTRIDDHIEYLMVRIDPDKVAPLKDAAASQSDLRVNPVR
jgi:mannose-6-phosphate isomerase-like protein (cupin superfamily)